MFTPSTSFYSHSNSQDVLGCSYPQFTGKSQWWSGISSKSQRNYRCLCLPDTYPLLPFAHIPSLGTHFLICVGLPGVPGPPSCFSWETQHHISSGWPSHSELWAIYQAHLTNIHSLRTQNITISKQEERNSPGYFKANEIKARNKDLERP